MKAGGVGIFRPLKTRKLLKARNARNATTCRIGFNWNVSGTWISPILHTQFEPISSSIPNRGVFQDDVELFGLGYLQKISDAVTGGALHIEPGIWVTQPATTHGSDRGGESAAAIYSLIGTAKLNGVDPETYLREVRSRVADHPINRIEELLPWNLAADRPAESTHAA